MISLPNILGSRFLPPRMHMRKLATGLVFGAFTFVQSLSAAPMITVGDTVGIHVKAESDFQYLSNLTLSTIPSLVKDDALIKLTPGIGLTLFEDSQVTNFHFGAERSFVHFMNETVFNDEPWNLNFNAGYEGYPFGFSVHWDKEELLQNISNPLGGGGGGGALSNSDIVQTIAEQFNVKFNLSFSPKTGFRSGLDWNVTDYSDFAYQDYNSLSFPLTVFYKITPKLETAVGYRYRNSEIANGSEHNDHYLNLNLMGQLTSKTHVQLTLGFQNRNSDYTTSTSSEDSNAFSTSLGVTYQLTEKIQLNAGAFRDFNVGSSIGESIQYTSANLGSQIQFTPTLAFGTKASVWGADYSQIDREDFGVHTTTSFSLAPIDSPWTFRAGYHYDWAEFDINGVTDEYVNHKISLSSAWEY